MKTNIIKLPRGNAPLDPTVKHCRGHHPAFLAGLEKWRAERRLLRESGVVVVKRRGATQVRLNFDKQCAGLIIFYRDSRGLSYRRIARVLNRRKISLPVSGRWLKNQVRRVYLRNKQ